MSKSASNLLKLATSLLSVSTLTLSSPLHSRRSSSYPGFSSFSNLFVFGDSYTTTSFLPNGTQPSASNPLGNPPYPGYTSSNGPNWVDYLTVKYNASLLLTYNLAYGGATVDSNLVAQYLPTVLDLEQQIDEEFLPIYAGQFSNSSSSSAGSNTTAVGGAGWTSSSTLFAIWIGINDVGNSYYSGPSITSSSGRLNSAIFAKYSSLVTTLYRSGARNFLFLNVPPVDRSPLTTTQQGGDAGLEAADIADFNARISDLARDLARNNSNSSPDTNVNVFLYDAHALFAAVLDDPTQFPETAGYKNTTTFCEAYENGTPSPTTFDPSCAYPVNQYFWLNSLHPTDPMHELLAREVAGLLGRGPNVGGGD